MAEVAIDRERLVEDLQALIRIPSVTGSEEAVMGWASGALGDLGMTVQTIEPDLAAIRADADWPGEEMGRMSLPVVIGRVAGASSCRAISMSCRRAIPRRGPSIHGPARSTTARCMGAGRAT